MVRTLASLLIIVALASCGAGRNAQSSLPAGCRMGGAADLRQILIYADGRDLGEAVDPKRAAVTGEPVASDDYPSGDATRPQFRLSQDEKLGGRECLAFGWRVVPMGAHPAAASDF